MTAPFDADRVARDAVARASEATSAPARAPLVCVPLPHLGIENIPPRQWAYGHFLLFGHAAVLGALDGGGKGAMAVGISLAMIAGRPLLGERVWRTGPVAIVTYEDDQDEWHRRIAAACIHHGIDYGLAIDNIRFVARPRDRIIFATMQDGRALYPDGDDMIVKLRDLGAALLIVDPLNHAHGFDDGNNNVSIAKVAHEMNRIAWESGAAVLVLHHLRKGSTGVADDLMGATSLRATFRSCRLLAKMTPDEARALGVEREAWRYSRLAGSKENYAPPPDRATWFRLESVSLGNVAVDPTYPEGDQVQVTTTWQPPALFDGIDAATLAEVLDLIRKGPDGGEFFSPSRQAKHWVGEAIAIATGKTPDQAARVLKQWTDNAVLLVEEAEHPHHRRKVKRVIVNETKAAEMTRIAKPPGGSDDA